VNVNDNLISSTAMRDSSNVSLSGYDTLNRPTHQRDSRTGVTTTAYLSTTADVVASVTDPGSRTTAFTYDARGRRTHVDAPNSLDPAGAPNNTDHENITQTFYFPDGNVQETTGGQTYRTTHTYDYADRQKTLTTYGTASNPATTTWIYSPTRGFLLEKNYAGEINNGPGNTADYTYTAAGRLRTRTWERGVGTTYYYDSGGRQLAIDYSDSTPDVLFGIDALGRITNQAQGALVVTNDIPSMASPIRSVSNTYDPTTLRLESETHNLGGITRTIVRSYESAGRPDEVAVGINTDSNPATLETTDHYTGYLYGADGRLLGIDAKDLPRFSGKDYGIEYGYITNSASLIHTLTRAGTSADLVTTHTWDTTRDALLVTDNRLDGAPNPVSQYAYTVNPLGQRDKVETVGTAFGVTPVWNWAYNPRGELVSAKDTSANNRNLGYIYDGIGNRLATGDVYSVTAGVEQVTNPVNYTPNALNQYTVAKGVALPTTPAPAPHDLDGNLRFDGGVNKDNEPREYVWDGENRLIEVLDVSGQSAVSLVTYGYDSQSRRIRRTDEAVGTTTWYLYDGWNVVAEYTGSTPALARTQTWGTDLSGTLQGAGGVGGLLGVRTGGIIYYPTYDGNGNISEYLTTSGVVAAHFEYDPFGNLTNFTEQSQGLAASFTYRFSTKPIDSITGLFYYGYRWYEPVCARWPSRDPIGEDGGENLYASFLGDGINRIDLIGLHAILEKGTDQINVGPVKLDLFGVKADYSAKEPVFWKKVCCIKNQGKRVHTDPGKEGSTQYIVSTSFEKDGGVVVSVGTEVELTSIKNWIKNTVKSNKDMKKYSKYLDLLDGKLSIGLVAENVRIKAHYDGCKSSASWAKSEGILKLEGTAGLSSSSPPDASISYSVGLDGKLIGGGKLGATISGSTVTANLANPTVHFAGNASAKVTINGVSDTGSIQINQNIYLGKETVDLISFDMIPKKK
jgi:RHS repeat-associated protein